MGRVYLSLVVIGFSLSALASHDLTLKDLSAKLANRGRTWVAGKTSVSDLTFEQKQHMLGAILPKDFSDYFSEVKTNSSPHHRLANALDWRNVDGVNYTSPILNQGFCGSCVAFATIGALETQMNISRKTPFSPWEYSAQHLFTCGGGGCNTGWQPFSAVQFLQNDGVPDEACFPYASGAAGEDLACTASCSDATARATKIAGYTMPTFFFMSEDAVKEALKNGPLITTMMVYEDFFFYKGGVYKHTTGQLAGGHAVTIIGYSDADKAWIVRNSWGMDWGDGGFFKIAYDDDSGVGRQTFALQVGDLNGFVAVQNVRDHQLFTGQVPLQFASTYPSTQKVEWVLQKNSREILRGDVGADMKATIDTTKQADGIYSLLAVAHYRDGEGKSQPRTVYVLNSKPTGTVAFTSVKAGDKLKGEVHLELATSSAPIPFTRVTFRAKNVATGEVTSKSTGNIAAKMILNWRTMNLKAGDYDLSLEGDHGDTVSATAGPIRISLNN